MNINAGLDPTLRNLGQIVLPQHYAEQIQKLGTEVELEKDQMLCKEGDIPDSCYYLCQGQIIAYEYTSTGSEHIFSVNQPGELILAPSMMVTHPLLLNFKASMPTRLIRIPREIMFQAMMEDPSFSAQLVYSLSLRLIASIEQSHQRSSYNVPWRVCNLLLSMAEQSGVDYDGKLLIQEKISQQTMANMLHANRVTVARAIRDLKNYGLVEYINGYYCIRAPEKLKKHMSYLETIPGSK